LNKLKILNDPIYGFITIPNSLIFDLIQHKYFQRLRRITQMGMSHLVYPGAHHTRFHHALGCMHLMQQAVNVLRFKGVNISDDEENALYIAILLHDIGHGPFSHALEGNIVNIHHEEISLDFMKYLNEEFDGQLKVAIEIFEGSYPRKFLKQLVSSQLDMDRMDYLTRDSYYSGVAEGVIGYKRIISMLNVVDNELVVEEKGVFSIEKFLVARHIMYWQVYLHKTSISAEQMLKNYVVRLREEIQSGNKMTDSSHFHHVLKDYNNLTPKSSEYLHRFAKLDDFDVYQDLKTSTVSADPILEILSKAILDRRLFGVILSKNAFDSDFKEGIRQKIAGKFNIKDKSTINKLLIEGEESSTAYNNFEEEIKIVSKDGDVKPVSTYLDILVNTNKITKFYLCYPK